MPFVGMGFIRFASDGAVTFGAGTPANSAPNTPTLSAGSLTSSGATLTGSAFSDPDVGDTHAASQWQVTTAADTGYASPVISTGDDATNKTSYAATGLTASTNYIARVRYKDSAGNYSGWATSVAFATSAAGTQFTEDWSSNSIRSTVWGTAVTGSGAASAATGALVMTLSAAGGTADVTQPGSSSNRYDLTTAGALAGGVVADLQAHSGGRAYFAITDATGLGWSVYITGTTVSTGAISAGAGSLDTRYGSTVAIGTFDATRRYWRFLKSGTNMLLQSSPDNATWTTERTFAIGAQVVTAMGVGFCVGAAASATSFTVGTVVVS